MSKQTETNLFMFSPLAKYAGLYQQLLSGVASYKALGNRIIREIKSAHAFRQVDRVRGLCTSLINVPIREYQLIGQYYMIWCRCRESHYDAEDLETLIEQTQTYKVKALSTRGTLEWYKGNNDAALYFYSEALRAHPTVSEYINLSKAVAVLKGQEGFHRSGLRDLDNLLPVIKHAEPLDYYDFLNSYAVELTEAGRVREAENVARLVVASPFSSYYPEWKETFEDVRRHHKRRSTISIGEPMTLPTPQPSTTNVIQFPSGERIYNDESISDLLMSALQALAMVIRSVAKGALTETQIEKICDGFQLALELLFTDEE